MKLADRLQLRQAQWQELETLCIEMEKARRRSERNGARASRFATLYRSACADLALADALQLPPNTVQYLHRLVGRAHNQLYRSRTFDFQSWAQSLLFEVPHRVFHDGCVKVSFFVFWVIFLVSAWLAANPKQWPDYAEQMIGPAQMARLDEDFRNEISGRNAAFNPVMASFYIRHNTGIGLECFVGGLLFIPGLIIEASNAVQLGACFGYMARPDNTSGKNFFEFVTAHGPFELTAIVLSAGAGLRLGLSWIKTLGFTRGASLRRAARDTMPVMGAAMVLFFLAALIEAFLSPSAAPYWCKALVAVLSSGLLMFYFVILGFPRDDARATG